MAKKSDTAGDRYTVLRDYAEYVAGDVVTLTPDDAALLIRDGIVAPVQE